MNTGKSAILLIIILIFASIIFIHYQRVSASTSPTSNTAEVSVKFINSTITADGTVTAQNQATLNFQTPGKLISLPFKEGDTVAAGQTIAQLDTYALQRLLKATLNSYRSTRDTFDQVQQNSQDNQLQANQKSSYTNVNIDNSNAINDAIKRIVDQNQANLDNSVVNVELANYALQLSTLTSPINGVITHEDVTVSGMNITTATTFKVADPDSMVFRANVPAENIYYVNEGNTVSISIDGIANKINGTVLKIYPSKVTLPSGEAVYQVDIKSNDLKTRAKLDQAGSAIINTNSENVALVPAWTVLNGKFIWIDNNGTPELRQITSGKTHGQEIEITSGLTTNDKILVDPKYIESLNYKMP